MSFKGLLLGSAIGVALAVPAYAADMSYPVKAPPVAILPAFTWTGFYLGANVGYGWGDGSASWDRYIEYYYDNYKDKWDEFGYRGGSDPEGWFGGLQIGYNYQFSNNVVLGVEADVQFGSLKDDLYYFAYAEYRGDDFDAEDGHIRTEIETFGTIRARLGYAFDRVLPYVTGGLAWGNVRLNETWREYGYDDGPYDESFSYSVKDTLWGWTVGVGIEYAFLDNWTMKVEYLYADLGDITFDSDADTNVDVKLQTIKLGINYKF